MTVDGPRDRSLRVGDRERDAAGELLKQAHLEVRIDTEELQARLGRCLAARTYAELDALVADLPSQAAGAPRAVRTRPWPLPFPLLPIAVIAAIALGHGTSCGSPFRSSSSSCGRFTGAPARVAA
jgi:hypothetical protein